MHDWRYWLGWAFVAVGFSVSLILRYFRPDLYKKWFGRGGDDGPMGGHHGDGGHSDGGNGH